MWWEVWKEGEKLCTESNMESTGEAGWEGDGSRTGAITVHTPLGSCF